MVFFISQSVKNLTGNRAVQPVCNSELGGKKMLLLYEMMTDETHQEEHMLFKSIRCSCVWLHFPGCGPFGIFCIGLSN